MLSTTLMCIGIWQIIKWVIGLYGAVTSKIEAGIQVVTRRTKKSSPSPSPARATYPRPALARGPGATHSPRSRLMTADKGATL